MNAQTFDHVALWLRDPEDAASFLTRHLGMHVIASDPAFVLVGAHALHGKLTLFRARDREPSTHSALERIELRVRNVEAALSRLPAMLEVERLQGGAAHFRGPEGLPLGVMATSDHSVDYDLGRVTLGVSDPVAAAAELRALGFDERAGELHSGGIVLALVPRATAPSSDGLLNHIALRVQSVDAHIAAARRSGAEIADIVDAPNTRALFLWGPDRIKVELVEHKPTFALV